MNCPATWGCLRRLTRKTDGMRAAPRWNYQGEEHGRSQDHIHDLVAGRGVGGGAWWRGPHGSGARE